MLSERIRQENNDGYGVHMPHVYVGDPTIEFSETLIETMAKNGGDIIEVGIPFSDPVADGTTFQGVCERALSNGTTPSDCLDSVKRFREKGYTNPVVLTTYYNIPFAMGLETFADRAAESGVNGLIIPNMPVEEAGPILDATRKVGIDVIFLVAPTTTETRLEKVVEVAEGFLYVVNVEGVTGSRKMIQSTTLDLIKRVREYTDMPLLAGFGVSNGEHAENLMDAGANGVIAGSVYANLYTSYLYPRESLSAISEKAREIKAGCRLQ